MTIYTDSSTDSSHADTIAELSTRLASINVAHDRDIYTKEDRAIPFPLWALLVIYEKANYECYIDYMQGFKALASWLTPITRPLREEEGEEGDYIPAALCSYETQRIAVILNTYETVIVKCLIEEVMPRMK